MHRLRDELHEAPHQVVRCSGGAAAAVRGARVAAMRCGVVRCGVAVQCGTLRRWGRGDGAVTIGWFSAPLVLLSMYTE